MCRGLRLTVVEGVDGGIELVCLIIERAGNGEWHYLTSARLAGHVGGWLQVSKDEGRLRWDLPTFLEMAARKVSRRPTTA